MVSRDSMGWRWAPLPKRPIWKGERHWQDTYLYRVWSTDVDVRTLLSKVAHIFHPRHSQSQVMKPKILSDYRKGTERVRHISFNNKIQLLYNTLLDLHSYFTCSNMKLRVNFDALIRPCHAERHQNIKADLMYRLVIKISALDMCICIWVTNS